MPRRVNLRLLVWTLVCVLVLAGAVHVVHSAQVFRLADDVVAQAQQSMERKEFAKAAGLYGVYLDIRPDDTEALAGYADALRQTSSSPQQRFKVFLLREQVVRRHPDDIEARKKALKAAIEVGRNFDAIRHLEQLLSSSPHSGELEHQLGWCLEAVNKYEESAHAFQRAIELAPQQIESYTLLAELYSKRLEMPGEAAALLDAMIGANAASARAYLTRARFHVEQGNPDLAMADVQKACVLAPGDMDIVQAGVEMAAARGQLDKARALLEQALKINPVNDAFYRWLAQVEALGGRPAEAVACLQRGLEEVPNSKLLQIDLASLSFEMHLRQNRDAEVDADLAVLRLLEGENGYLWRIGESARSIVMARRGDRRQLAMARKLLVEIRRKHGEVARAVFLEAQLVEIDEGMPKAVSLYQRAFELGERPSNVVLRVAQWLADRQRFLEAEQILRRLEDQAPLERAPARLAAEVSLHLHDGARAFTMARKAVSKDSLDYRELLWLAHVLWVSGEPNEATETFHAAVKRAPHVPETWAALARHLTFIKRPLQLADVLARLPEAIPADRADLTWALCLEACGRLEEAETALRKALEAKPSDLALQRQRAEFYLRTDQRQRAESALRFLLGQVAAGPELDTWARRQLAVLLASHGEDRDLEEALTLVRRSAEPAVQSVEDERVEAYVLSRTSGHEATAVQRFESTLDKQALTSEDRFLLAQIYDSARDEMKVSEQLNVLLTLHRDNANYLAFYVQVLLKQGDVLSAETYLKMLELVEPRSARTHRLKIALEKGSGG